MVTVNIKTDASLISFVRYALLDGVASWGGWMFVGYCFIDGMNGVDLSLSRLKVTLIESIIGGIIWGSFMWFVFRKMKSRKYANR